MSKIYCIEDLLTIEQDNRNIAIKNLSQKIDYLYNILRNEISIIESNIEKERNDRKIRYEKILKLLESK